MRGFLGPSSPIAILRIMVGLIFISHSMVRLVNYTLPGFGNFLESQGFPGGFYLAWAITIFELVGGALMVLRKWPKIFCIGETIILITGVVIVHAQNGWFVVGKTLGGVEYSVVLIIILTSIFIAESSNKKSNE